jgi:UDP-N-acetylmuramate dehydrogenase
MRKASDALLAPFTTLEVGGRARAIWTAERPKEVQYALEQAPDAFVLGGGSNVVFADDGYDGIILHMGVRGITARADVDTMRYEVGAGESWDAFVARTLADGCAGLECLSGIPGTVGGTPIQNVGAYGREVKEHITEVRVIDRATRIERRMSNGECRFAYRMSRFKRDPSSVVVGVTFELPRRKDSLPVRYKDLAQALAINEGGSAPLQAVREAVIALRRTKGMVSDPADSESRSVGSFFTNPTVEVDEADRIERLAAVPMPRFPQANGGVKLAAAWLVEQSGGFKGETLGGARISKKHALAIVNGGGATAADIVALAQRIRDRVAARFGIELEPEPVLVGLTI